MCDAATCLFLNGWQLLCNLLRKSAREESMEVTCAKMMAIVRVYLGEQLLVVEEELFV